MTVVADNFAALTTVDLQNPINVDETNTQVRVNRGWSCGTQRGKGGIFYDDPTCQSVPQAQRGCCILADECSFMLMVLSTIVYCCRFNLLIEKTIGFLSLSK